MLLKVSRLHTYTDDDVKMSLLVMLLKVNR